MDDTRKNREKREEIILNCLKKLAEIEVPNGTTYHYQIETWTKNDSEPVIKGKSGIEITLFW